MIKRQVVTKASNVTDCGDTLQIILITPTIIEICFASSGHIGIGSPPPKLKTLLVGGKNTHRYLYVYMHSLLYDYTKRFCLLIL